MEFLRFPNFSSPILYHPIRLGKSKWELLAAPFPVLPPWGLSPNVLLVELHWWQTCTSAPLASPTPRFGDCPLFHKELIFAVSLHGSPVHSAS